MFDKDEIDELIKQLNDARNIEEAIQILEEFIQAAKEGQIENFVNHSPSHEENQLQVALDDAIKEINKYNDYPEPEIKPVDVQMSINEIISDNVETSNNDVVTSNNDVVTSNNDVVTSEIKENNLQNVYPNISQNEIDVMNLSMPSENLKQPVTDFKEVGMLTNDPFTSTYQFLDAQNNDVPGSDQLSSPNTFDNQFCIQGN